MRQKLTRIAILGFINAPMLLLMVFAGIGDSGLKDSTAWLALLAIAIFFIGALVALFRGREKLALVLGSAIPVSYIVFASLASIAGALIS